MNNMVKRVTLILVILIPSYGYSAVLPGLFDAQGNPLHTADEFSLQIHAGVAKVPQGYQYNYSLQSSPSSLQSVWAYKVKLPAIDGVVLNSSSSPWGVGGYPRTASPLRDKYFSNFTYTPEMLFVGWAVPPIKGDARLLVPSGAVSGFTFISPYPPGISFAYAEGLTPSPAFAGEPSSEDVSLPFHKHTPYGPGKVMPVIGPVKPTAPNVTDNYSVVGCVGGICDVQLDITGPQDPYGTAYTYTWAGAFGTAFGAKPIVQLSAGAYQVSVAVSDPYATLVTATMPITVVDPNPPVVVNPPAGGGNAGGGNAGSGNAGGGNTGGGNAGGGNAGSGNTGGGNTGGGNAGGGAGQGNTGGYSPYNDDDSSGDNSSDDASSDNQSDDDDDKSDEDSESN